MRFIVDIPPTHIAFHIGVIINFPRISILHNMYSNFCPPFLSPSHPRLASTLLYSTLLYSTLLYSTLLTSSLLSPILFSPRLSSLLISYPHLSSLLSSSLLASSFLSSSILSSSLLASERKRNKLIALESKEEESKAMKAMMHNYEQEDCARVLKKQVRAIRVCRTCLVCGCDVKYCTVHWFLSFLYLLHLLVLQVFIFFFFPSHRLFLAIFWSISLKAFLTPNSSFFLLLDLVFLSHYLVGQWAVATWSVGSKRSADRQKENDQRISTQGNWRYCRL